MNCEEFRAAVGAEPNRDSSETAAHSGECVACAAYRRELRELDRTIFAALHTRPRPRFVRPAWSIAAGVLLVVGLATVIGFAGTRPSFADEVVRHAQGEPRSLVDTLDVVSDAELSTVLARAGLQLRPGAARISYAQGCSFRGRFAPHLVVQTDKGPVTVLVLPDEATHATQAERIHESGFDGVIVPAPRGVLVVLSNGAPVDLVAQTMLRDLVYTG